MRKLTADQVQETTVSTGTPLTLTQNAGFFRFSDRFSVNDRVYVSIRDGNNWYNVFATVGASNTLALTTVLSTLVGGTAGSGGAITLSGASAVVRAVIPEELFSTTSKIENVLIGINTALADGFSYGFTTAGITGTLSASPVVNDRVDVYQAGSAITGCVIDPNGGKINGTAGAMTIDLVDWAFSLIYVSAGYGWKIR